MKRQNFLFGLRPIIEAIKEGKNFEKVFVKQGVQGDLSGELRTLLIKNKIHFQYVPVEKLNKFTRKNHQGVIGFTSLIDYYNIEDILPMIFEKGKDPFVLVLDRITDVRNFGAIARTADCAGVDALIVPTRESALINEDAMKTSAGALNHIRVCKVDNLKKTVRFLKESGLTVYGATEKASRYYYDAEYSGPLAIVMGSEEDGISIELMKEIHELIRIPLSGNIESLNVSVATGVVLFECVKQRKQ